MTAEPGPGFFRTEQTRSQKSAIMEGAMIEQQHPTRIDP
jgi:hypothetical protein